MRKKVILVGGARPNFMKIAPLISELKKYNSCFKPLLVHTGQHYDFEMSEIFFKNLKIPNPDIYLNVGSGSHATQTAKIMVAFEKVLLKEKPDLIIVFGDINSTMACSLVASKLNIKVAHVEAGLRSFDRTMPEEINRMVTDLLSDYLFVSEESGIRNLKREGINSDKVHFVGNVMIDTLLSNMKKVEKSKVLKNYSLQPKNYCVLTMHRPNNVDKKNALREVLEIISSIQERVIIIYPIHPRTKKMMKTHGFLKNFEFLNDLIMVAPQGYIDFIKLVKESSFVLTDSGGIQEESTVLGVPCLTMRENTERPITIEKGTNYLLGRDYKMIISKADQIMKNGSKNYVIPKLWDGNTSKRIIKILRNVLS